MKILPNDIRRSIKYLYRDMPIDPSVPQLWPLFVFFAATVRHLLQVHDRTAQLKLFRDVLYHQGLSFWEDDDFYLKKQGSVNGWDSTFTDRLRREPGIICTYHTGSYRLLNHLLIREELPFVLLLSHKVKKRLGHDVEMRSRALSPKSRSLKMLDAENPSVLFQIRKTLEKGMNVLMYIDGNTGSAEGGVPITFFDHQIRVRTGAAAIAHWLKVPIYPVASSRYRENISFEWMPPIQSDGTEPRDAFALRVTQQLYTFLERIVKQNPAQWEGWLFLHHVLELAPFLDTLGSENLLPFKVEGVPHVLNLENIQSYPVSPDFYNLMLNNC